MNLVAQVRDALASGGCVSQVLPGFTPRLQQSEMAQAVARAVTDGGRLVVEAGTGVGKTYAYLVPALLSGERVLVSTATKALQDQLFARDLPQLLRALGIPVRTALLKGRSSYLCAHRLSMARQEVSLVDAKSTSTLAKFEEWARLTQSGDLAEMPGLDERSPVIPWVTSTRENCLGSDCAHFRSCHVNLARRDAMAADLVVVNHHLFFADLAVRESGVAELLPTARVVIFDEAHQLNDIGVQFLGTNWGSSQIIDFTRDMLVAGLQLARGLVDWNAVASDLERVARELDLCFSSLRAGGKIQWTGQAPEGVHPQDWLDALSNIRLACEYAAKQLATVGEIGPDFVRLGERAAEHSRHAKLFSAECPVQSVRWVEIGINNRSPLRLFESPLDIAKVFQTTNEAQNYDPHDHDGRLVSANFPAEKVCQAGERQKTWVFTSATLGNEETLSWFCDSCGLKDAQVLRLQSPFDYAKQAALYIPGNLPLPAHAGHSIALAYLAARAVSRLGGRTLILTTTLKALKTVGNVLQDQFPVGADIEVLVQGQQPKRYLMERFRDEGSRGCVLVASATFWEGFDVPGDALQLVVIDKLPFPPPNDPLVQARARRLEASRLNPFSNYFIPEVVVALKQGAGRLIRHESDRGVLLIGDSRLIQMPYGKRILKALPPMRRVESEEGLLAELDRLNVSHLPKLPPGRGV
jgi:ATP-dependent DNA helicase DinG